MASVTASAAAPTPPSGWCGFRATESILIERQRLDPQADVRARQLLLARPGSEAVLELTPLQDGIIDGAASWSPRGERIAFERSDLTADQGLAVRRIHVMDANGAGVQRITQGPGEQLAPAWGPGNRIAFVARQAERDCLATVDAHGRRQQDLFCAPAPARMQRPAWSADGRSLLVVGGYFTGGQYPAWHSLAWRIDAATGAPSVLEDRVLLEPLHLELSPDGSRGIYAEVVAAPMVQVEFATGAVVELGTGYAPRWSRDGQRIAFTGEVYEDGPEFRYYEPLYVMRANGSDQPRRLTRSRVDNHAYVAVEWSQDDSQVLVNRRVYTDPSRTASSLTVRVVDVQARTVARVASGLAEPGAWNAGCAAPFARPALRGKGRVREGAIQP
jgi:dipeptidyl aminopeptidase/acylaminoacyl peptidase